MAGWQCAAGRAILRMEAREMAPLAGTTKNTILRFERGEFMPRPQTVEALARLLRERGVFPTFSKKGDPKGVNIGWQAYKYAYPERPAVKHRIPEEIAAEQRAEPERVMGTPRPRPQPAPPALSMTPSSLAALEAQSKQLLSELRRLKGEPEDDEDDWSA